MNELSSTDTERRRKVWDEESHKFATPYFRLEKAARMAGAIAGGRDADLLDIGCGPATLARLLDPGIAYHGIDIAIQEPTPNLIELDFLEQPIAFGAKTFDIVVAMGVFEYTAGRQDEKLAEIRRTLKSTGKFLVSYTNFGHRKPNIYHLYNNVRPLREFRASLSRHFVIDRHFPTSYNWNHGQPNKRFLRTAQRHLNLNVPLIGPTLAVEYCFICSPREPAKAESR
jgi:SAM-dependent methyltransferase